MERESEREGVCNKACRRREYTRALAGAEKPQDARTHARFKDTMRRGWVYTSFASCFDAPSPHTPPFFSVPSSPVCALVRVQGREGPSAQLDQLRCLSVDCLRAPGQNFEALRIKRDLG